mmetsp:Transcript_14345/g.38436  ORF Transcript_14345/g.38436 Transcript_14345/m.38436 type:complete len:96 (+) Transcript_14345:142-429(+)
MLYTSSSTRYLSTKLVISEMVFAFWIASATWTVSKAVYAEEKVETHQKPDLSSKKCWEYELLNLSESELTNSTAVMDHVKLVGLRALRDSASSKH